MQTEQVLVGSAAQLAGFPMPPSAASHWNGVIALLPGGAPTLSVPAVAVEPEVPPVLAVPAVEVPPVPTTVLVVPASPPALSSVLVVTLHAEPMNAAIRPATATTRQ
jgi:hypothetical protein